MIIASIYVTGGAILIGVPIALFTSVFMARYCPQKIYRPLKSGIELMAGVPSIVYGFFGLVLMVPLIRSTFGGTGTSWLAASLLLAIMILPTIIGPTESALRSVPESYYEGSLALGATKERSIFMVMLPAAKSGILAAVVLGIGRAIGETMAVLIGERGTRGREMPVGLLQRSSYHDCKHRNRNGLCYRASQRSTNCNRSSTFRVYPDHQPESFFTEQEVRTCKLMQQQ